MAEWVWKNGKLQRRVDWAAKLTNPFAKISKTSTPVLDLAPTPRTGADLSGYLNDITGLSLNDSQWESLLESGGYLDQGLVKKYSTVDTSSLLDDVQSMLDALSEYSNERPLLENYLADARAQVEAENAEMYADLDKLLDTKTAMYTEQLKGLSDSYDYARSNLLSQQYQQNSQLMDSLQSGMERSRRNALEAGASAGIRIADNINTLLSVQNKQSATSMETANQLAQMMVNQRNAEASVRNSYADTLSQDTANRHSIKMGSEQRAASLANTNYSTAEQSYAAKEHDFDQANIDNPFYTYKKQLSNRKDPVYSKPTVNNPLSKHTAPAGTHWISYLPGRYLLK